MNELLHGLNEGMRPAVIYNSSVTITLMSWCSWVPLAHP